MVESKVGEMETDLGFKIVSCQRVCMCLCACLSVPLKDVAVVRALIRKIYVVVRNAFPGHLLRCWL